MAETIKSVLLVDYDSLHRSLSASDEAAAGRLVERLVAWVSAIEIGSLFAETSDEAPQHRRFLIRRCYADPTLLGNDRTVFLSNGFQVVDCPPAEGRTHNAAAIHMVLDSIDALDHPADYDDYVLLSADSDLTPLLIRLRAHNRTTSIYTNTVTAESYKTIADAMIEESRFAELLLSDDEPTVVEEEEEAPPKAERSEIEALARKISSTTNVPLFAPRTFAELFRHLVEEVAENGYHFQKTAENVATRMADSGRNVSRRQVVFVVKGLALKGHVFSSGDTADRLADVFREQVLYLAESAGLELDDNERTVISAWIVGSVSPPSQAASETKDNAPVEKESKNEAKPTAARPATQQPGRSSRKRQTKANGSTKPREDTKPATAPAKAKASDEPTRPTPQVQKPSPKSSDTAKPTASPSSAQAKSTDDDDKPAASSAKSSSAASRQAQSRSSAADEKPKPTAQADTSAGQASAKRTSPAPVVDQDADPDSDVESSILAAIAEAVDVLVEDSGSGAKVADDPVAEPPQTAPPPAAKKPAPVEDQQAEEDVPEGDDIGDEIQRIIASYNRNRNKNDPE